MTFHFDIKLKITQEMKLKIHILSFILHNATKYNSSIKLIQISKQNKVTIKANAI